MALFELRECRLVIIDVAHGIPPDCLYCLSDSRFLTDSPTRGYCPFCLCADICGHFAFFCSSKQQKVNETWQPGPRPRIWIEQGLGALRTVCVLCVCLSVPPAVKHRMPRSTSICIDAHCHQLTNWIGLVAGQPTQNVSLRPTRRRPPTICFLDCFSRDNYLRTVRGLWQRTTRRPAAAFLLSIAVLHLMFRFC